MSVQFPSSPEDRWSANGQAKTRQWMCCQCGRRNIYSPWASACTELLANIPEFRRRYDCFHDRCMRCVWKWSHHPPPDENTPIPGIAFGETMDEDSEDEGYESLERDSKEPALSGAGHGPMVPMLTGRATPSSDTSSSFATPPPPSGSPAPVVHDQDTPSNALNPTLEAVQQHIFEFLMQREEERMSQEDQHSPVHNQPPPFHHRSDSIKSSGGSYRHNLSNSTIDSQDDYAAAMKTTANTNTETSRSRQNSTSRKHGPSMSYAEAAASAIRRKLSLSLPTSVAAAAGAAVAVAAAAVASGSGFARKGKRGSRHPSRSIGGAWFA
ncbi:hypothetical protein VTJ49DRAFT_4474 [Mycothermus thermophilus]|uniref:Stc1 domain-containing protein n=1 Tax=Humicola insolens TaxID=85995 RepID=A0ABR3VMP6_HUMIN